MSTSEIKKEFELKKTGLIIFYVSNEAIAVFNKFAGICKQHVLKYLYVNYS